MAFDLPEPLSEVLSCNQETTILGKLMLPQNSRENLCLNQTSISPEKPQYEECDVSSGSNPEDALPKCEQELIKHESPGGESPDPPVQSNIRNTQNPFIT